MVGLGFNSPSSSPKTEILFSNFQNLSWTLVYRSPLEEACFDLALLDTAPDWTGTAERRSPTRRFSALDRAMTPCRRAGAPVADAPEPDLPANVRLLCGEDKLTLG